MPDADGVMFNDYRPEPDFFYIYCVKGGESNSDQSRNRDPWVTWDLTRRCVPEPLTEAKRGEYFKL